MSDLKKLNIRITSSTIYRNAVMTLPDGREVKKRFGIMDSDADIAKAMAGLPAAKITEKKGN